MIKNLIDKLKFVFQVDRGGNLIFQLAHTVEMLSFPELKYFSIVVNKFSFESYQDRFVVRLPSKPDIKEPLFRKKLGKFSFIVYD